jgi:hypothetical protein
MGIETMGSYDMKSARRHAKGFTLIASLLLLLLLSGIAIGLMMMVNTEGKVGGTDLQNNVAFHSAEGGVEKMTSDLAATFQNALSPTAAQICALGNTAMQPSLPGVTWKDYIVTPGEVGAACPSSMTTQWGTISAGPNQGLWAQIIPVNMMATAALPGGQEVSMTRTAQVALIPVFQFGAFSESDLSFFSGPSFDIGGPVHTNGDLYPFVGPGSNLVFHNQVSAYGNVVRTQLANGWNPASNYTGTAWMPTANNGCTSLNAAGNCTSMDSPGSGTFSTTFGDGSLQGAGGDPATSAYNTSVWNTFSKTTTLRLLVNGNYGVTTPASQVGTGATKLSMPFVGGGNQPFQIIRRPVAGESAASSLGQSREYNLAQIHVLLSDDPAELPGGAGDANNVRLANVTTAMATATGTTASYGYGVPMAATSLPSSYPAAPAGTSWSLYFAAGSNAIPIPAGCSVTTDICTAADWPYGPATPLAGAQTLVPTTPAPGAPTFLNNGTPAISICPPALPAAATVPVGCPTTGAYPYYAPPNANGATLYNSPSSTSWNLIDGWLRVEYKDASGNWHPVTSEWLSLGFARGVTAPTLPGSSAPATGTNPINPNAILLLQEPADRYTTSTFATEASLNSAGTAPACTATSGTTGKCTRWSGAPPQLTADSVTLGAAGEWQFAATPSAPTMQSLTQYNWYPINFYDAREGEVREATDYNNDSCTTNGVMNAVEIDVGNLKRWLAGSIGTSGASVDYVAQNGYVLYYSDRRGMLPNPNAVPPNTAGTKSGDSGLEDVINVSTGGSTGTPDGTLEPPTANSPEDTNQNGVLDNFGAQNLGLGFTGTVGNSSKNLNVLITSTNPAPDPYGTASANNRIAACTNTARKNWVSGARHVLKLVDGSLGNVPISPIGTITDPGGFTVAAENPVYIQGDYNSSSTDTVWNTPPVDILGHSSAAVIADTVTLLSDSWDDRASLMSDVTNPSDRNASTTRYRVAIAAGKTMNFQRPSWGAQDFGTDGGLHNFLRYLENWGSQTLYYKGSIVSLFYSTYNTGTYKSSLVYSPPTRGYSFDLDFSSPQGLPPGTPLFRDVNSLGYRQLFTTRTY